MNRLTVSLGLLTVIALAFGVAGCNSSDPNKVSAPPAGQPTADSDEHAGHTHSDADMEKAKAEIAKLSPEDAAAATKQHICPVTSEMLGSMGPPKKVDVSGRNVWICCEGCRDELLANPDKHLAKLKKS